MKPTVEQTVFAPGRKAALAELRRWASSGVNYGKSRDVLHLGATSHLSAYLHFGILGPVEVMNYLRGNQNRKEFLRQLLWREFYLHIVWKQHTDYSKKSRTLKMNNHVHWRAPGREFKMWVLGRTGCPIVDAGMRELAATGYIQNRARMIVAMYLIYHLRIDWRLGEMHFARELTDYDYCNNLGGWLWCAGWEVYSNEWFRPFSMASQMERFDPEAKYVTRWCPELRSVEPRDLWDWSSNGPEMAKKYPRVRYVESLVPDMAAARAAGIEAYSRAHS
jgi:deoxyribodipyrimidine photo-lyase